MYQDSLPTGSDLNLKPPEHADRLKNFIKCYKMYLYVYPRRTELTLTSYILDI